MAKKISVTNVSVASGGHAPVDFTISQNEGVHQGKMVGWKAVSSNWAGAGGYYLKILDADGDAIYTSALIAKNTTTIVMGLDIPLIEKEISQIDLSDDPGVGGGTVTNIRLFYHPDE